MKDESRDHELDQLLGPLRQQHLSEVEVDRIIGSATPITRRPSLWVSFAFAAGLSIGIGGTLLVTRSSNISPSVPMQGENFVDEFATVRQVIAN